LLPPAEVAVRGEENLESSESLLPINDLPDYNMTGWGLLLLQYHCAQKVIRCIFVALQRINELSLDVLPQRQPVLLFVPYVLPLKQWYFEPLLRIEYSQQ
jgi:hypothetical protein